MKKKFSLAALAFSFVFALGVVAAPVYAVVEDDSMTYEEKQQYIEEYKKEMAKKKQELREQAEKKAAEIKKQAEERAKEAKEQADQKRQEVRQQKCEQKSERLGEVVNKRAQTARGFYERFSGFSDKVERFIEAKSLSVDNYTDLYAAVDEASANADAAIAALEELKFEVNCDEVDLTTENASNYRDAVVDAREALKQYRTALVNLLRAVVTSYNASQATEESTESEDSSQTEPSEGESTEPNSGSEEEVNNVQ